MVEERVWGRPRLGWVRRGEVRGMGVGVGEAGGGKGGVVMVGVGVGVGSQVSGYHGDGLSIGTYKIAVVLNGRWNIA